LDIRNYQYTVLDYCEMYERHDVRVNRDYQRSDEVWPRTAQSFLVETILLDFPVPKLFIHQVTDLRTNRTVKEIVDGQQRTRAVVDFYHDEYRLTNNVTLDEAAGRKYSELPGDLQERFKNYGLNFDLFVGSTDEEVREVFRRMNSFTVPLNPEEQRHAEFQGEFKWFMRKLSTEYAEAFRAAGVFGQKALVRMQDQKLLTEISAAYFSGIRTTNKRSLDAVYRNHDRLDTFPDDQREELGTKLRLGLDSFFDLHDLFDTPLAKPHQAYALILALIHLQGGVPSLRDVYPEGTVMTSEDRRIVNLTRLAEALEEDPEQAGALRPFVDASAGGGTNVAARRQTRFVWYCRALADQLPGR
jgi:hypothetical protein